MDLSADVPRDHPSQPGGVRAVARALDIVRLLAEARRSLGVADIAGSTGQPPATVHRLLATLVAEGWVEQSRFSSRYRLGTGILGSAAIALAHAPLLERGRPALARVAAASGMDAYLSVLVGRRVAFLEWAPGAESRVVDFHPGISQPAHCTAAGKVLLAFLPSAERRARLREPEQLRRYTPATIIDPAELEQALAAVHADGYATDSGEFRETHRSIAVPVLGEGNLAAAALSCGGPAKRMTRQLADAIREELLTRADELSRQVGLVED